MTMREILRSVLALIDDLEHSKTASGHLQMCAVRTKSEVASLLLHFQLEHDDFLDAQIPMTMRGSR